MYLLVDKLVGFLESTAGLYITMQISPRMKSFLLCAIGALSIGSSYGSALLDETFFEGEIKDACGATYSSVEKMNIGLRPISKDLVQTDYFRYYKVDLSDAMCPFHDDELGMCGNKACAIDPIEDETEIPEFWRTQYLGKLAKDSFTTDPKWPQGDDSPVSSCMSTEPHPSAALYQSSLEVLTPEVRDTDYCYPEDESRGGPGVYVDLVENPERFTGYGGAHAHKVWRAVYQENCFGYHGDEQPTLAESEIKPQLGGGLSSVIMEGNKYEQQEVGGEAGRLAMIAGESQCTEQRLFYRLLSGMQASVSSHLCFEYLNKSTGEWKPNLECFTKRVGDYPERLSNLYFNYALVSRAVSKLHNYIDSLSFCREDSSSDSNTRDQLLDLSELATSSVGEAAFNESILFSSPEGKILKDEFRKRVRNVNALMSCVGCDRCRLWGKLQTAGYGTALKLLFELPEKPSDDLERSELVLASFRRSELVALINTFDRLSKSVEAVVYFRKQAKTQEIEAAERARAALRERREAKRSASKNSSSEWDPEWAAAWEGIKFILNSYVQFPRNLWHLFISHATIHWNKFISRPEVGRQTKLEL